MTDFVEVAQTFLNNGFSVIPTGANKVCALKGWKSYQDRLMTEDEARKHFATADRLAAIGGKISGNLECLDFDDPKAYAPFLELLTEKDESLAATLVKRKTPSGGFHLIYRCVEPVNGNLKLAMMPGVDEAGKPKEEVIIETRGEGGYFLTSPSPGYSIIEHGILATPIISPVQVETIHTLARMFDKRPEQLKYHYHAGKDNTGSPGTDYNNRHTVTDILTAFEWKENRRTTAGTGWTRPGKENGISGVLLDETGNFYCWSSNAFPLEAGNSYSAFALYTAYEHGCDYSDAARTLASKGYGTPQAQKTTEPSKLHEVETDNYEFLPPVLFDSVDTPNIPAELFPEPARSFIKAVAESSETPVGLTAMVVLGTVATAASKKVTVSPKAGWEEPVNIYSIVALPPANNKSYALKIATAPLIEWEKEQALIKEPEIKRQWSERKSQEKHIESMRGRMAKEKKSIERNLMVQEIADLESELIEPEVLPQLTIDNITPESLETITHEQGGKISIVSDEGGILETLSGLYSGGRANVDVFLKGIDGGYMRVRRSTRSFDLNPFLTIVLCVQNVVIKNLADKRTFHGNGSLERFLYLLPKSNLGYRTHDKPAIQESTKRNYSVMIHEILNIQVDEPKILNLSNGALRDWQEFQAAIEIELRPGGKLEPCRGWGGKICGFALRIAGLFHVIEHKLQITTISAETMANALTLAALLREHALAAFDLMGAEESTADAKELLQWIQEAGKESHTQSEITLAMRNRKMGKPERLRKAITELTERYIFSKPQKQTIGDATKPTTIFMVNPSILNGGSNGLA